MRECLPYNGSTVLYVLFLPMGRELGPVALFERQALERSNFDSPAPTETCHSPIDVRSTVPSLECIDHYM